MKAMMLALLFTLTPLVAFAEVPGNYQNWAYSNGQAFRAELVALSPMVNEIWLVVFKNPQGGISYVDSRYLNGRSRSQAWRRWGQINGKLGVSAITHPVPRQALPTAQSHSTDAGERWSNLFDHRLRQQTEGPSEVDELREEIMDLQDQISLLRQGR